jgi:hypothetical protein
VNHTLVSSKETPAESPIRRSLAVTIRPALRFAEEGAEGRADLERRVAQGFSRLYGARIEHFLPLLLSLDFEGNPGAIAGLRCAGSAELFLEQYLDVPIEQATSACFRQPVDRGQIVEIGNLVSTTPGAGSLLFAALPALLERAGIRWVACTATPQVRAMLKRLGFPIKTVCAADASVLGQDADAWGSYYDATPSVIVGDVRAAARRLRCDPDARRLHRRLWPELLRLGAVVRSVRR